jgi:hypothetical protein
MPGPSPRLHFNSRHALLQKGHILRMVHGLQREERGLQLQLLPPTQQQQCPYASEAPAATRASSNIVLAHDEEQRRLQLQDLTLADWTEPQLPPQQVQQQCRGGATTLPAAAHPRICSPTAGALQLPELAPVWPAGPLASSQVGGVPWVVSVLLGSAVYRPSGGCQVAPDVASVPSMTQAADAAAGCDSGDGGEPLGGLSTEELALLDAPGVLDDLLLTGEDFM